MPETNMTARNAWIGVQDGAPAPESKQKVFVAKDGQSGRLVKCHICGNEAHPENINYWMFRLEGGDGTWYWEWDLSPLS